MARRRQAPGAGLGHTQKLVLLLLALDRTSGRDKSARYLAYDWPGLGETAAHAALARLEARSLVEATGWDNDNQRTYALTEKGAEVERTLSRLEPEEEE